MALEPRKPLPFLVGGKQADAGQRIELVFAVCVASLIGANVSAQPPSPPEHVKESFPSQKHYSPYADRNFPTEVLWGDTHLHTGNSLDAGAFGATLLPEDAHRFARGEELTSSTGLKVKLSRPLDFLVVADHSDNMGFFPLLQSGDPSMLADPLGKKWYDMIKEGGQQGVAAAVEIILSLTGNTFPDALYLAPGSAAYRNTWDETIAASEKYNEPGRYTAMHGYEWTSTENGANRHVSSFTEMVRAGLAQWSPIRHSHPTAALTSANCGRGCRATRISRVDAYLRFHITVTLVTA